jgi:hypothetical protein
MPVRTPLCATGKPCSFPGMGDYDPLWEPAAYLDQNDVLDPESRWPLTDTL